MSYCDAMKMAGATVHEYKEFGSYQGDWLALVTYKGKTGFIHGYYGSCSGCDSFQSQFDFRDHEHPEDDYYTFFDALGSNFEHENSCDVCKKWKEEIIEFGKGLLEEEILSPFMVMEMFKEQSEWDLDAIELIEWVKTTSLQYMLTFIEEVKKEHDA